MPFRLQVKLELAQRTLALRQMIQDTETLTGGPRGANGTTKATHSVQAATVTNISDYVAWGEASSADFTIAPGLWVLDNYGTKLIALIYNGECFEWDCRSRC